MPSNSTYTLITGASTGIGRELADIAARDEQNLIVVARSADKLEALAEELRKRHGVSVHVEASDLSKPRSATKLYDALRAQNLEIGVVINNAGFGSQGAFHETALENQLSMLELNIVTLTELTRLCLADMVARGKGRVMNVGSTASFQPGPLMAVYYASKAYVLSFTEAIAEELRGTGVTVTALCPGPTKTEFQAVAGIEDSNLVRLGLGSARSVAEAGYRGMKRGKVVVIPGLMNRLGAVSVRLSPRFLVRRLVKTINRSI